MRRGVSAQNILRSEKIRFGLVGAFNTGVDFGVLFILARLMGVPTLVANVVSTTCALIVSYTLNKKAVFRNTDTRNHRQVLLFVVVTLAGLWGVQSAVIMASTAMLHGLITNSGLLLLVTKGIATLFSLVWNYLWYSRVVFRKDSHEKTV